jgi:AraC-like DNA-binding protein
MVRKATDEPSDPFTQASMEDLQHHSPLFHPQRTVIISSPYDINETLAQALPSAQRASVSASRSFQPLDRRGYQAEPGGFGVVVAGATMASTQIYANTVKRGLEMVVQDHLPNSHTFGFRKRGAMSVTGNGRAADGEWTVGTGVIFRERPGLKVKISDDHVGVTFDLPHERVVRVLEGLIERPVRADFAFAPAFSMTDGPGTAVARLVHFIEREIEASESLMGIGPIAASMEDLLIRTLLFAHRHTHSDVLDVDAKRATPANVRRAEAFMRAHAAEAISIERLAAEAGCGVRSLQMAFRQFCACTPMEALRRFRLEAARQEIENSHDGASLIEIALKYHFSNQGRFARHYRALFGKLPSNARERKI